LIPQIALYFALLSLVSVGGIPSVMPEMQRLVVDVQGWMSAARIHAALRRRAGRARAERAGDRADRLEGRRDRGRHASPGPPSAGPPPRSPIRSAASGTACATRPGARRCQRALVPISVGFIVLGGYVLATPAGPDWRSALIAGPRRGDPLRCRSSTRSGFLAGGGVLGYFLFLDALFQKCRSREAEQRHRVREVFLERAPAWCASKAFWSS
jgi:chromate transporter